MFRSIILLNEREINVKLQILLRMRCFRALCETVEKNMFHDSKEFPDYFYCCTVHVAIIAYVPTHALIHFNL